MRSRVPRPRFGHRAPAQPELIESWRASVEGGTASVRCDSIIQSRDLPIPLLDVLARVVEDDTSTAAKQLSERKN